MDNNILNHLVIGKGRRFSDLVDSNMLSNAMVTKPYETGRVISYVLANEKQRGTVLDALTGALGNVMVVDQSSYEWSVEMDSDVAITIRKATWNGTEITSANANSLLAGIGNTPIMIWTDLKWFGPGAVVELDDKEYQLRFAGEPYQDGNQYVYTGYIVEAQPGSYIPGEFLVPGRKISRLGAFYEEFSEEGDILNYGTHIKMRNSLFITRLDADITGTAYSTVMWIGYKDPRTGKTDYLWGDVQEWKLIQAWSQRTERMLAYSRSNQFNGAVNLLGTNGRPVSVSAGLLQQIAPSNKRYYTELTTELLEDFLFDLSYNLLGFNQRKFVALTGEMGMKEFDRVLKEKVSTMQLIDTVFVSGSGQELTLGGQFTTYKMLNGVELTLKHFPVYDSTEHNRLLHPITKKPLESYRFTFLDVTPRDGKPNIVKVVRKDREYVLWNTSGSVAPGAGYGKSISTVRSNAKDGYSIHVLGEMGICIFDPRACGELIMLSE